MMVHAEFVGMFITGHMLTPMLQYLSLSNLSPPPQS